MSRLRQQYPQNYGSSGNISAEFENFVRYLNAAEHGNRTVGELLGDLFDDEGVPTLPIEFRRDVSAAVQYRVGEFDNADDGWVTLFTLAELRGQPGTSYLPVNGTPTGIMLESNFVDSATGLIPFSKLLISDGAIPAGKVAGLAALFSSAARIFIGPTTPVGAAAANLWLDTSATPNQLKFYSGVSWVSTTPANDVPAYANADANRYLRVNPAASALEWAAIDLSSRIPVSDRGATNGVATLDAEGRLPVSQLPEELSLITFWDLFATPANGPRPVSRVFKQTFTITAVALRTSAGSCSVQLSVNGAGLGTTYSVTTTPQEVTLGVPIIVDASVASKLIGYIVSANSGAADLDVTIIGRPS